MLFKQFSKEEIFLSAKNIYAKYVLEEENDTGLEEAYYIIKKLLPFYNSIETSASDFIKNFKSSKNSDSDIRLSLWQAYILHTLAKTKNNIMISQIKNRNLNKTIANLAEKELENINYLFNINWQDALARMSNAYDFDLQSISPMNIVLYVDEKTPAARLSLAIKNLDLNTLIEYFRVFGTGLLSQFFAFEYSQERGLWGITTKKHVHFCELYGLETQKEKISHNIERLLNDRIADNILLYGNSGTGKSTTVKAILGDYHHRGLRLISLAKDKLSDIPSLIDLIRDEPFKFLIFVDDLSFEESEIEYKTFKSVLEGRLSSLPQNAIICVTSNRLNIIKETWSERNADDIHRNDNIQEKRSLSERFGLKITYPPLNKTEYLAVVEGILREEGINKTEDVLRQALEFERRASGASGRVARQFVNKTIGERA
jgi:predicted AAA+ superfamily ATPase